MSCELSLKVFLGTTGDYLEIHSASDCEIGFIAVTNVSAQVAYLRPQEARQAALHILKLCDEIEGKSDE